MKEAIGAAEQNKFSEFSKKVKTSLEDKLRSHPKIVSNADKIRDLEKMKDTFSQISKKSEPDTSTNDEVPQNTTSTEE
jgi:hypothetical protein